MHERFKYKTFQDLIRKSKDLGLDLPLSEDISPLLEPLSLAGFRIQNRLVVQPMEGYDAEYNGSPSEMTERRYLRYATGGSGMIWYEAVAVTGNGRSNPRQLWITKNNSDKFSFLNDKVRRTAARNGFNPLLVVQLTHSGRYSRPEGKPKPQVAAINPVLDKTLPYVLTDDDLKRIQEQFVNASRLAARSGFNAIDLKACHGYLIVDLLASKERKESVFGGEETSKRFRFLLETIDWIRDEVPGMLITTRLNISDLYKGGFGVDGNGLVDLTEPRMLTEQLKLKEMELINLTMGSPYFNPYVTRPFDVPVPGQKVPEEHPLEGVARMISQTSIMQKEFPEVMVVSSAWSYLRQFAPNVAAAVVKNGGASFIGFGRSSFAYPDMPADLMNNGKADPGKVCISCSGCSRLSINMRPTGCVIRDKRVYGNELKKLIADGK
ncbi:MAG: hypothetical protein Q8868_11040 [Bacteroidota bacterium]|nr:hypothetical protein [Bacteroidota bacterium]